MSLRKKFIPFILFLICCVLLSGCTGTPSGNDTTADSSSAVDTSSAPESTESASDEPSELLGLRAEMKKRGSYVGIGFVDYVGSELSEEDVATYLGQSDLAKEYPFVKESEVAAYDGMELFVLVPASETAVITVYPNVITDEGELEVNKNEIICKSEPGKAVALRCNISESYPNVLVAVTDGNNNFEFSPSISLEDGISVAAVDGTYDFSLDDIRKYTEEAYNMLVYNFAEVDAALDNGKGLVFASDFYFCDQMMLRFELGEYTDDGFSVEKHYAVSFDATYGMDPADHEWTVIGTGLNTFMHR